MKRGIQGIILAALVSGSMLISGGCTTEQRSGRSTGQYIDDKTINARVRSALSDSLDYKFPDVKVETMRGTVQLSGFVATAAQKAKAGDIAKNVRGVVNLDNKITLK